MARLLTLQALKRGGDTKCPHKTSKLQQQKQQQNNNPPRSKNKKNKTSQKGRSYTDYLLPDNGWPKRLFLQNAENKSIISLNQVDQKLKIDKIINLHW